MTIVIASCNINNFYDIKETDKKISEIAKPFDGKNVGAGMGFGKRDVEFEFDTHFQAERFMNKCRELNIEAYRID
jgi:hypothetical protein